MDFKFSANIEPICKEIKRACRQTEAALYQDQTEIDFEIRRVKGYMAEAKKVMEAPYEEHCAKYLITLFMEVFKHLHKAEQLAKADETLLRKLNPMTVKSVEAMNYLAHDL